MTGFGAADGAVAGGRLHLEVKSVNHRHLNVQLKLPTIVQGLEASVRDRLRARLDRGHVVVSGRWTPEGPGAGAGAQEIEVDVERARAVLAALRRLGEELGLPDDASLEFVARQPEVLSLVQAEAPEAAWEEVAPVLDAALDALIATRAREGQALAAELGTRLRNIGLRLELVEARAPERVIRERDRLREAVAELIGSHAVDEARLAQEVALMADRIDITEETVRLRTHLDAALGLLEGDAPIGKQLGFLAQEMLREINTIGSKANDAPIAEAVIAMKGEHEKVREQVENLE